MVEEALSALLKASPSRRQKAGKALLDAARAAAINAGWKRPDPAAQDVSRLLHVALEDGSTAGCWAGLAAAQLRWRSWSSWIFSVVPLVARALESKKPALRHAAEHAARELGNAKIPQQAALIAPLVTQGTDAEIDGVLGTLLFEKQDVAGLVSELARRLRRRPTSAAVSALKRLALAGIDIGPALPGLERARRSRDFLVRSEASILISLCHRAAGREAEIPAASPPGLEDFWPIAIMHRATFGIPGKYEKRGTRSVCPPWCAACGCREGRFTYCSEENGAGGWLIQTEVECPKCGKFSLYTYNDTLTPRWGSPR